MTKVEEGFGIGNEYMYTIKNKDNIELPNIPENTLSKLNENNNSNSRIKSIGGSRKTNKITTKT